MISAYFRPPFKALPASWSREDEWLVARCPLRYYGGKVYELETAVRIDANLPGARPPSAASLALILMPAMWRGRHRVTLPTPLDPTLEATLPKIQALYESMFPEFKLHPVPVSAPRSSESDPAGDRVGVFMSGGVDSFFSLLQHIDEVDDIILIRGFDIGIEAEHDTLWQDVLERSRSIADETGKRLVEVRSNLRPFLTQKRTDWGITFGLALVHVAYLLSPWLRRVYIPSSVDTANVNIRPWGSHPDVDPLWSSTGLDLIHDGADRTRLDKLRYIADSPLVARHLRVCNAHPDGIYNCGRCSKCIVTMLGLATAGALENNETFPPGLEPVHLERVGEWGAGRRVFLSELMHWWQENEPDNPFLPVAQRLLGND